MSRPQNMPGAINFRTHTTAVIILVLYWMGLMAPYIRAALPNLPHIANELRQRDPQLANFIRKALAERAKSLKRASGSNPLKNTDKGALPLRFPNDSALLAEFLKDIAAHVESKPLIRTASMLETVGLLTNSMWCTMIFMGALVFGFGFSFVTCLVFKSIRIASRTEPVTLSFLFSIPGIRYVNNHYHYHVFGTPLQPRRRFASFVGAGTRNINFSDLDQSFIKNIDKRKEGVKINTKAEPLISTNALGLDNYRNRRRSMPKSSTEIKKPESTFKKRLSIASTSPQVENFIDIPSNSVSSTEMLQEESHFSHEFDELVDEEFVEKSRTWFEADISPHIAVPAPVRSSSNVKELETTVQISSEDSNVPVVEFWEESDEMVEDQKESVVSIDASAFVERLLDPFVQSCATTKASRNDNMEECSKSPPLSESKLFRRFQDNDIGNSKLGRHFTKSASSYDPTNPQVQQNGVSNSFSLASSTVVERQLKEGDMSPPPGFYNGLSSLNESKPLTRRHTLKNGDIDISSKFSSPITDSIVASRRSQEFSSPTTLDPLHFENSEHSSSHWRWFDESNVYNLDSEDNSFRTPVMTHTPARPHSAKYPKDVFINNEISFESKSSGRVSPVNYSAMPLRKTKGRDSVNLGRFDEFFKGRML